jgi:hypothetical protein
MAIGRNILSALGGLLDRGPDEDDPTLTPEERERRRRMRMANRTSLSRPDITPTQTGRGGPITQQGLMDASRRLQGRGEEFRATGEERREDDRKAREAQETAQRNIERRRGIKEGAEDASQAILDQRDKEIRRGNLRDAEGVASSDFQDRESQGRILEGILKGRAEDQAQEQADQDLIDANRQASEQRRAEGQFGQDVRRHFGTMNRMAGDRASGRIGEQVGQGMDRSVDRMRDMADQARMKRLEGITEERSADALSQPTGELDMSKLLSTQKFDEPELPPEDAKSPYEPSGQGTEDNPYMIEETVVEADKPEEEEKQGLLSRLGGMVKGNPELFAQIAQLGGGLVSGMAQDKAQRRADATTQDRMARANLIGALTGRTPQVAAERADTGGFFSLDTLGKAIKGGGELAQDEIQRREDREQLEYDRDIAEDETEYQREQDKLDRQESAEKINQGWAEIRQGGKTGATALKNKAAIMKGSVDVVNSFLDKLENFQELNEEDMTGGFERVLDGLATNFGFVGSTLNAEAQGYTDSRALIVAEVARIINGGGANVSAKEQEMAESVVPDIRIPRDAGPYGIQKMKRLREILQIRLDAVNEGINATGSIYDRVQTGQTGNAEETEADTPSEPEPTEAEVAMQGKDLTPEERALLRRAQKNPDDTEVQSAIENNPKLRKAIGRG